MGILSNLQPPLLPTIDAILILDGDGSLLTGKYYNQFLSSVLASTTKIPDHTLEIRNRTAALRSAFERQIHSKIAGISAQSDAAEVISVAGKTAVFCGGSNSTVGLQEGGGEGEMNNGEASSGDVRVIMIGPPGESELVMAHFCEAMYEALSTLMGGATDRNMVLDNLELVLLLIDEHCDGGIILEIDPHRLVSSVILKDDDGTEKDSQNAPGSGVASTPNMMQSGGELTMAQAFRQARDQFITGLGQRDGL